MDDDKRAEVWLHFSAEDLPQVEGENVWRWPVKKPEPPRYKRRTFWQWLRRQPRTTEWQVLRLNFVDGKPVTRP